jgi:hypothetical protein
MSNGMQVVTAEDLAKLKEVTGAPLSLSPEEAKSYDEMLVELLRCYKPRDFMEELLIAETVVETWTMRGHRRHPDLIIKRRLRQLRELDLQRKKLAAQAKEARERAAAEKTAKPQTELARACDLEDVFERSLDDVRKLDHPPVELEYAEALEKTIVQREHFDTMLNSAIGRRNNNVQLIELYREWQCLQRAANEIVDAASKDATPQVGPGEAPLVPAAEEPR